MCDQDIEAARRARDLERYHRRTADRRAKGLCLKCGKRPPAPGAASAARAGVSFSFAGRSVVFRRRRFGPALLRKAPRCSCPAVACGDRGVSDSTWAAGLLFGADGVAVTVSVDRTAGMPSLSPPCPANVPEVSRDRRLPCLMSMSPAIGRMAHRIQFAPAARRSSGMAHPCPRGCISRRSSAILAYRATALRHLGVAIHELWLPRPHRISTGCLVSQSVGMAPDHAATGRLQHGRYHSASTKAAPEKSSYHPYRCCAQGRFSAPSLPDCRTGRQAAEGAFGRFRAPQR